MAWKLKYRCKACGYEAEVYEGRGLFRQQITAMSCHDCKTIQNIVVGGSIADVAPSYRSEVGRLCLQKRSSGHDHLSVEISPNRLSFLGMSLLGDIEHSP